MMEKLEVESCKLEVEESWGIIETISEKQNAYGYRFYPDKIKGEGFFISAFRKNISGGNNPILTHQRKQSC